jgi:hypothetical protein
MDLFKIQMTKLKCQMNSKIPISEKTNIEQGIKNVEGRPKSKEHRDPAYPSKPVPSVVSETILKREDPGP